MHASRTHSRESFALCSMCYLLLCTPCHVPCSLLRWLCKRAESRDLSWKLTTGTHTRRNDWGLELSELSIFIARRGSAIADRQGNPRSPACHRPRPSTRTTSQLLFMSLVSFKYRVASVFRPRWTRGERDPFRCSYQSRSSRRRGVLETTTTTVTNASPEDLRGP